MFRGAAHDAGFARRMGVPQDVARDFVKADTSRPLRQGLTKNDSQRKTMRYGK